jgi:hypothetical protein
MIVCTGSLRSGSGRSSRGGLNSPLSDSSQLSAGARGSPPMPSQVSRLHKIALLESSETYSPTGQHRDVGESVNSCQNIYTRQIMIGLCELHATQGKNADYNY